MLRADKIIDNKWQLQIHVIREFPRHPSAYSKHPAYMTG
jgi:hypothetical protein